MNSIVEENLYMEFCICQVSVAPVRSTFSDKGEMVTQLLFGETVIVLEKKGTWRKIKCSWDNYIGWTDHKLLSPITPTEMEKYNTDTIYSLELVQAAMATRHYLPILLGSSLPMYDGIRLMLGEEQMTFSGQVFKPSKQMLTQNLVQKIACKYLNAPYLWGGRSPFGIDCSGFTQVVFKILGFQLNRDASQQVEQGELVDFVEQVQVGDLAFFENRKKRIAHVGIVFPERKIIHAYGKVRIDLLDHYGIFNVDTQSYTHRLRVIKRILPTEIIKEKELQNISLVTEPKNQMDLF